MHILGLSNGTAKGNSEIALKAALSAAQSAVPSSTTSWVHVPSVSIPLNPQPFEGSQDVSVGSNVSMLNPGPASTKFSSVPDDRRALLDAILDADALIFSTPVYSHSPAGFLKAVFDRVGGPFVDAAFADTALRSQRQGDPRFANMSIDRRLLKPRVVAFIAVGGSSTPDQFTLALPVLHSLVYPLHAKVVDQVVFTGVGGPGTIVAREGGKLMERVQLLGRNVADQLGRSFDEAEFMGESPEGGCPYCHLVKFEMFVGSANKIVCVGCGAQGALRVGEDGVIRPVWDQDCGVSSITWKGKKKHIDDLAQGHGAEAEDVRNCKDYDELVEKWRRTEIPLVKLPSQQE